jgi:membrane protein DedA with SNARE-associated domain
MGPTEMIAQNATAFIAQTGYAGVFVSMVLESMVFPLPSEAVMPFAGFLIADARLTFAFVIVASTLGSITGSLISFTVGRYGGKPFIDRFGRYFLLNRDDLFATEHFFGKYGDITIFVCRFIPVIRHLISLPAGTGRMNVVKFTLYTIAGAGLWNACLTVCGFFLRKNWGTVMHYSRFADIAVVLLILVGIVFFIKKHLLRRKRFATGLPIRRRNKVF